MEKRIAVLAGDGIGPEVMAAALRVLHATEKKFGHQFHYTEAAVGGAAYEVSGEHFPDSTRRVCEQADAILFGSIGGPVAENHLPKWKGCETNSILAIRKAFEFHANLRPATVWPQLRAGCPLKAEVLGDVVDLLIVRELSGDIYFGEHSTRTEHGVRMARDVAEYTEDQIRAVGLVAFDAARKRRGKVTSVDKANVLDTSKLWRAVMHEVAAEFSEVRYEDMYVDNCAMQIVCRPSQFDVIVTANLFGDILSDLAAVLPGSLGLTPSASFNRAGFGLYEPSGGSAPDIAGKGIANPTAQILSAALMLRYSFGMEAEARAIEEAVTRAFDQGLRTGDVAGHGESAVSTEFFTDAVVAALKGPNLP